ncbi:hypothetical protein DV733_09455 [Halapricum salinum]|uniref:Uncharacterized protein n=2 Tax=Halapricum salinum TaxID=1457250 RepID=A0A4D6HEH6_9EURY|nr:hypothetical protein DV733_09455 [Halapricum salinum]
MQLPPEVVAMSECCKCGAVAETYGLEEYLERVERRWPRRNGPSVRDIERGIAKRVLRDELADAGSIRVDGAVTALVEVLTGDQDGASAFEWEQARHDLRHHGVDPDTVIGNLPSYRTVHRHLTECCGQEAPAPTEITADRGVVAAEDRIKKLVTRLEHVTDKTLTELTTAGHIPEPGAVSVTVQAECGVCGEDHAVETVICGVCPTQTSTTPPTQPRQ